MAIVWPKTNHLLQGIFSLGLIPLKGEIVLSKVQISYSKDTAKALVMAIVAGLLGTGVAVIGSVAPASAAACGSGSSSATYSGGDGTTSSTAFRISTSADLIRLSATSSDWTGKFFIQTADIDLGGCSWSPIGNSLKSFSGEYNGDFHNVSGFSITPSGYPNAEFVGLFGKITQATIKNFSIQGSISSAGDYVGSIVGSTTSGQASTITQVKSEVNITYTGGNYAGGLVGLLTTPAILSFSGYTGTMSTNANPYLGGIAGRANTVIESSYARATMTGTSSRTRTAGINAFVTPTIRRSFSASIDVKAGIDGSTSIAPTYSEVFWDLSISNHAYEGPGTRATSGAEGKTTGEMKNFDTFSSTNWRIVDGWDNFDTAGWVNFSSAPPAGARIWGICDRVNDGYPFLLWEYTSDPCTVTPPPSSGGGSSGSFVAPVVVPEAVVIPDTVAQRKIRTNPITGAKRLAGSSLKRDVVFAADSTVLTAAMKKTLRQAARLAIRDGSRLAITGFAANSPRGDGFEKRIAERRALNVANFLRKAGFENWIYYHGLNSRQGSEFPGQPRRVEIRLLK